MDKREINHLLIMIARGNNQAFEKLYIETRKGLYALLYPYFKNSYDTEDALEEVYIRVKQKAHLFQKNTDGRAWLFQLAKNYALNLLRSKNTERNKLQELTDNQKDVHDDVWQSTIFIAMQKVLTTEEYQIVIKHVLMYYKHKDIAKELNIPLGTVLSKYQTALKKLREELEHEKL